MNKTIIIAIEVVAALIIVAFLIGEVKTLLS